MPRIDQAVRIAWIAATVKVEMDDGTVRKMKGETMGLLSVHEVLSEGWSVTHVPTRYNLTNRIASAEEAKAIAEAAFELCPRDVLLLRTVEAVRRAAPEWFADWMRRCRVAGRRVEAKP